jgi:hypothetical protein
MKASLRRVERVGQWSKSQEFVPLHFHLLELASDHGSAVLLEMVRSMKTEKRADV